KETATQGYLLILFYVSNSTLGLKYRNVFFLKLNKLFDINKLCSGKIFYHVLNGGDPGGAFITKSTTGITYPIAITAIINTIHKLQRSVHFGVGEASNSSSAIGNSVSPFGALNIKWKTIYTTINTEISRIVAPIPTKIRYGSQLAATSLEK